MYDERFVCCIVLICGGRFEDQRAIVLHRFDLCVGDVPESRYWLFLKESSTTMNPIIRWFNFQFLASRNANDAVLASTYRSIPGRQVISRTPESATYFLSYLNSHHLCTITRNQNHQ
jgi:hypothetical protein